LELLNARFTDGKTAAEYRAEVRATTDGLSFNAAGQNHVWSTSGLILMDKAGGNPRLSHSGYPEARLVFEAAALGSLSTLYPSVMARSQDGLRVDIRNFAKFGIATVGLVVLVIISLPALSGLITTLIPLSYEKELGEETMVTLDALFDGAAEQCTEQPGLAALKKVSDRLIGGRDLRVPVDIRVVPVDIQNALALPGGTVLIFNGLLQKAESPEEVAGVLAHEIGHTQYRHGMQRLVQSHALSALVSVIAPGDLGGLAADFGAIVISQSYSRDAESEADDYAVDILNETGIRPDGMAEFFERFAREEDDKDDAPSVLQYLSSHPLSVERAKTIRARGTADGIALSDTEWQSLRAICGNATDDENESPDENDKSKSD
jgi:Zn-dependent protease with chaperone function